jgi:hypothetical protein
LWARTANRFRRTLTPTRPRRRSRRSRRDPVACTSVCVWLCEWLYAVHVCMGWQEAACVCVCACVAVGRSAVEGSRERGATDDIKSTVCLLVADTATQSPHKRLCGSLLRLLLAGG